MGLISCVSNRLSIGLLILFIVIFPYVKYVSNTSNLESQIDFLKKTIQARDNSLTSLRHETNSSLRANIAIQSELQVEKQKLLIQLENLKGVLEICDAKRKDLENLVLPPGSEDEEGDLKQRFDECQASLVEVETSSKKLAVDLVSCTTSTSDKEKNLQVELDQCRDQLLKKLGPDTIDGPVPNYPLPDGRGEKPLDLEMFPQPIGPAPPPRSDKTLLFAAVNDRSKELINKMVDRFGFDDVTYMFAVYDNSDWSELEWSTKAIFIKVKSQVKFWYVKRFVTPDVARAYKYIWIIDDDVNVEHIDLKAYNQLHDDFDIQASQPAHYPGHPFSHFVTVQQAGQHNGRWTNFVEIGPLVVFSSEAYQCAYHLLQIDMSTGWGCDLLWRPFCSFERMAVIDKFPLIHVSSKSIKPEFGSPFTEMYDLYGRYPQFHAVQPGSAGGMF